MAGDEAGVHDEEEEGEPVGNASCEGGADEVELEGVDEQVVEYNVQGGGDEQDVGAWAHDF